jgi:hypothetical protein
MSDSSRNDKEPFGTSPSNGEVVPGSAPQDAFVRQIASELEETAGDIRALAVGSLSPSHEESLVVAKRIVQEFQPVPQFIWRIAHFTMGRAGRVNKLSDGNLFGLKKLVLAIGKDKVLGKTTPMLTTRAVLDSVSSDVIAAVSVIHAIGRKLQNREFQAVWGPILDDALMRAGIGYFVGTMCEDFGPGRGMLAGFAGRVGLALLIATGTNEQAQTAIARLAGGQRIEDVALELYGCEPLHVSAMVLSAAGCGRESVLGLASFTMTERAQASLSNPQKIWLSALTITESVRAGTADQVSEDHWARMGYEVVEERAELNEITTTLKRRGHGWNWML